MPFLSDIRAMILAGITALLLIVSAVQTVRIEGFGIWPLKIAGLQDKYDSAIRKLGDARRELKRISDAKDKQGETTNGNIEKVENGRKRSETIAKRIEAAPLPGNCSTPKEILEADL